MDKDKYADLLDRLEAAEWIRADQYVRLTAAADYLDRVIRAFGDPDKARKAVPHAFEREAAERGNLQVIDNRIAEIQEELGR